MYHHLSLEERERMYGWKKEGKSFRWIAKRLNRNVGSIAREWHRHTRYGRPYLPCRAHRRAARWADRQRYQAPLKYPLIFLYVREHLRPPYSWSPETIAGRLPIDHLGNTIGVETIYRYIYGKKQRRMTLWNHLLRHRRKRMIRHGRKVKQYGRLATAIPIALRPNEANRRLTLGHWETDNMEGVRSDKTVVSVTVDRLTRVTRIRKLANHTAHTKAQILIDQFRYDQGRTLTVDRGAENSDHETITNKTGIPVYACNPYHSWEKPTVENTVGRVRRYVPKGVSIDEIPEDIFLAVEGIMNTTPRKVLGFLTPNEVMEKIQSASSTS